MRFAFFALFCAFLLPAPAKAQQLLETYVAHLSSNDHFNSKGARLTQPWQIIRQDRANYHRFGIRDSGDQYDSFFASKENRAHAERMLRKGFISQQISDIIVNGEVTVLIEIYGQGSRGTHLTVTLF